MQNSFGLGIVLASLQSEAANFDDPWDGSFKFTIKRRDAPDHQSWLKNSNPLVAAISRHIAAETARSFGRKEVKQIAAPGQAEIVTEGDELQNVMETVWEKVGERIDAGELPADVVSQGLGADADRREARALIVEVLGPDPEHPEKVRSLASEVIDRLLSLGSTIPEGNFGAGREHGAVLVEWVLARATEQADAAQRLLEDAAKN